MPTADRAVGIPVQRRVVVRVQVYGSRGDDQARGIQHLGRIATLQAADFGDLAVLDADIGVVTR